MERYALGDDRAFRQLHAALAPRIMALLIARGCDRALAQDLLQQTFLHVHQARASYRPKGGVTPWVFSIARRVLVDYWRHSRKQRLAQEAFAADPPIDPEGQAISTQLAQHVRLEFARLSAAQRGAFDLVRFQGLSLAEAAAALQTSVSGVKLRLHRADTALRNAANPPDEEVGARVRVVDSKIREKLSSVPNVLSMGIVDSPLAGANVPRVSAGASAGLAAFCPANDTQLQVRTDERP